ncbi:hypothetical protein SOVF_116740, partial [Spinacia oleracea]
MVSESNQPDWPPPGWEVKTKRKDGRKIKFYINSTTRQKFYSKPEVLRYLRDECVGDEKIQPTAELAKKSSGEIETHHVEENDFDWLPTGWVLERRIRKSGVRAGTEYKCYIDPSTDTKCFSKPEVLRYLAGSSGQNHRGESGQSSSKRSVDPLSAHKSDLEPNVSQISKTRIRKSLPSENIKVVTERTVDEDLPSGWIKETRIKMIGKKVVKRNPSYIDPVSRLVFRSKAEVLRYLKTGEISRHAYQRKNGSIIGNDSANEMVSTSSKSEETPKSRIIKTHLAGEASSGESIQELPEAVSDEKVEGRRSTRSSARVRPAPIGVSSPKQSTLSPESAPVGVSSPKQSTLSPKSTPVGVSSPNQSTLSPETAPVGVCSPKKSNSQEMNVSSKREETPKRRTRQSIQALPETGGNEEVECRKTRRLSSRLRPALAGAGSSSSKQSTLSPESARNSQEMVVGKPLLENLSGTKETVGMTKHAPSEVQDAGASSSKQSTLSPESASNSQEMVVGKPLLENLFGTEETVVMTKHAPSEVQDAGAEVATLDTSESPAASSGGILPEENAVALAIRGCSNRKGVTGKRKTKDRKLPCVSPRSSKRLAGVDAKVVFDPIPIRATSSNPSRTKPIPSLELVHPNELQEKCEDVDKQELLGSEDEKQHQSVEVNAESVLTTRGEPSNKIDHFPSLEEKDHTLDFNLETVLATEGESSNKIDDLTSQEETHHPPKIVPEIVLGHGEASNKIDEKHHSPKIVPEIELVHGEASNK